MKTIHYHRQQNNYCGCPRILSGCRLWQGWEDFYSNLILFLWTTKTGLLLSSVGPRVSAKVLNAPFEQIFCFITWKTTFLVLLATDSQMGKVYAYSKVHPDKTWTSIMLEPHFSFVFKIEFKASRPPDLQASSLNQATVLVRNILATSIWSFFKNASTHTKLKWKSKRFSNLYRWKTPRLLFLWRLNHFLCS